MNPALSRLLWLIALAWGCGASVNGSSTSDHDERRPPDLTPPRDFQALNGRRFSLESAQGFVPIKEGEPEVFFGYPDEPMSVRAGYIGFGACITEYAPASVVEGRLVVGDFWPDNDGVCLDRGKQREDKWFRAFLRSKPWLSVEGERIRLIGETATLLYLGHEWRPLVEPALDE